MLQVLITMEGVNPGFDMRDIAISGPAVLAALTQACSQDASVLKPAEQQLHSWETQPGFYTVLHVNITVVSFGGSRGASVITPMQFFFPYFNIVGYLPFQTENPKLDTCFRNCLTKSMDPRLPEHCDTMQSEIRHGYR